VSPGVKQFSSKMNSTFSNMKKVSDFCGIDTFQCTVPRLEGHVLVGRLNFTKLQGEESFDSFSRHIKALQCLEHPNILYLRDIVSVLPESTSSSNKNRGILNEVWLETDFYATDLRRLIKTSKDLTDLHVQYFVDQLLCGLRFMHFAGFYHEYIRPEDILVTTDCQLAISDCRNVHFEADCQNSLHQTESTHVEVESNANWYRAPEILLCCREITSKASMWSLGCILAELLARKPLFPGRTIINVLDVIASTVGTAPLHALRAMGCSPSACACVDGLQGPAGDGLPAHCPAGAADLLARLLRFDPAERPSAEEALAHEVRAAVLVAAAGSENIHAPLLTCPPPRLWKGRAARDARCGK
jgi:serine/threonine protein kinase